MPRVSLRTEHAKYRLSELGLTQLELAEACAVDVRTVQRWLAGGRLKMEDAQRLASALCLGTAELCEEVHEPGGPLARVRAMHRALVARDGAVAQLLRMIPRHYPHLMEHVSFDVHPPRGHVYSFSPPPAWRGFMVLHITPSRRDVPIAVIERLLPPLMLERAHIALRASTVWLAEHFLPRSFLAETAQDGSFDLWFWAGGHTRTLILAASTELHVRLDESRGPRQELDLAAPETAHAVCVRPGVSQLREAGLPRGFDRVLNRDAARVDLPVPEDI